MYGNTIVEPVETCTIIIYSREDFDKYGSFHYDYTDNVLEINGI